MGNSACVGVGGGGSGAAVKDGGGERGLRQAQQTVEAAIVMVDAVQVGRQRNEEKMQAEIRDYMRTGNEHDRASARVVLKRLRALRTIRVRADRYLENLRTMHLYIGEALLQPTIVDALHVGTRALGGDKQMTDQIERIEKMMADIEKTMCNQREVAATLGQPLQVGTIGDSDWDGDDEAALDRELEALCRPVAAPLPNPNLVSTPLLSSVPSSLAPPRPIALME